MSDRDKISDYMELGQHEKIICDEHLFNNSFIYFVVTPSNERVSCYCYRSSIDNNRLQRMFFKRNHIIDIMLAIVVFPFLVNSNQETCF